MSDNPIDIDAIRKRVDAATPGPWVDDGEPNEIDGDDGDRVANVYTSSRHHDQIVANRQFIAHARSDVPALLNAVRDRDAEIERLKARLAMAVSFQIDGEFSVIEPGDDDGESRGFWQAMRSGDGWVLTDRGDWIDPDCDVGEARFPTADAAFAALGEHRAKASQ